MNGALMSEKQSVVCALDTLRTQAAKLGFSTCVCLAAFACLVTDTAAASLFGDVSCQDWENLEHSRKKNWANAFLAPLSLTIQGLRRARQDPYNDDPNAVEPAIRSIDQFCVLHPREGAADGAASYLNMLTRQ
jgi:hypothetical protein